MQSIMTAMAVIYIPASHSIDRRVARAYWDYLQRRGYAFYAVVRDMGRALDDLAAGDAQVVVMVNCNGPVRVDPGATTVVDLAAKRDKMLANEPTVRLPPNVDDGGFAERFLKNRNAPRHMTDT